MNHPLAGVRGAAAAVCVTVLLAGTVRAADPPAAGPPAGVLDLAGALRLAASQSRAAVQAGADVETAAAAVDRAGARWLPSVTFDGTYTTRDHPVEVGVGALSFPMTQQSNGQYDLTAREVLWDGGRRGLAVDAAREGERAARAAGEAGVRDAQLQVVDAYLSVLELAGRGRVLRKRVAALQSHLGIVEDLQAHGLVARNDLLETRVRESEVEDAVQAVANAREVAVADLNRKLGREPGAPLALPDSLPPAPELPAGRDSLTAAAGRDNPMLQAAGARLEAQRKAARLARRAWSPSLFVALSHSYQENETLVHPHVNAAIAGVSWNLFDGGARKADIRAADAGLLAADRDRLEARRAVAVAVDAAWRDWTQARREEDTARANVAAAAENLRIVEDQYRGGLARSSDVLDAEALLADSRFTVLTRHHAAYRAQARLLATAGADLIAFYSDGAAVAGENR